jgi:hypothetical protein
MYILKMAQTRSQLIDTILDAKKKFPDELGHISGLPTMRRKDLQSIVKMIGKFSGGEEARGEANLVYDDTPEVNDDLDGVVKELDIPDEDEGSEEEKADIVFVDEEEEENPENYIKSLERIVSQGGSLVKKAKAKSNGRKTTPKSEPEKVKPPPPVIKENKSEGEGELTTAEFRRQQREVEKEAKLLLTEFKEAISSILKTPKTLINKYGSLTEIESIDLTDDYNDIREELEDRLELLFTEVEPCDTFYKFMNNLVKRQMNRIERVLN